MSTVSEPLKYLWTAYFEDGKIISQPEDDRYSKHDDSFTHNPSAFRDLLDYEKVSKLIYFDINDGIFAYGVDLPSGRFGINGTWFSIEDQDAPLHSRKLVYLREVKQDSVFTGSVAAPKVDVQAPVVTGYYFGFEGINPKGEKVTKTIKVV